MDVFVCSKRKGGTKARANHKTVYVGRGSALGNPFPMVNESERAAVIQQYSSYLWGKMKANDEGVMNELNAIMQLAKNGGVNIQCWCAPLPCHADVIKKALVWMDKE